MADIILSNRLLTPSQLSQQCDASFDELYLNSEETNLHPRRPYMIGKRPSQADLAILGTLNKIEKQSHLSEAALALGDEETLAIAQLMSALADNPTTLIGAGASVYGQRVKGLQGAVQTYQQALLQYREAIKTKKSKSAQQMAKQQVHREFTKLQTQFRLEMNVIKNNSRARKGAPLTNVTRATNIARSGRNAAKLHVANQAQAHQLVNMSKKVGYLGNGLVLFDLHQRIARITSSYQDDQDWEREMFVESLSLGGSTVVGAASAAIGASAFTFVMVATPVGWVGLIVGGVVVTGAVVGTASTTILTDTIIKEHAYGWYDDLMAWMSLR